MSVLNLFLTVEQNLKFENLGLKIKNNYSTFLLQCGIIKFIEKKEKIMNKTKVIVFVESSGNTPYNNENFEQFIE